MPSSAPKICGHCGKAHHKGEVCAIGARLTRERKARFDKTRPTARQRGYTAEWQRESKAFLANNPNCIRCAKPAEVVDHRTPHKGDIAIFWDRRNWQPLCSHCHNRHKQALERKPT